MIEHLYYDPLSEKLHFFNPEGTAHTTVEELEEELLSLPSTSCKPGLTISPNPVKGQAHLTLPEGPVRYAALTSTTGNSMPVNLKDHLLNVQGFQPGVYVLEVLVGDESGCYI